MSAHLRDSVRCFAPGLAPGLAPTSVSRPARFGGESFRRRGFSLIELMVVIGIIILLVSVVLAVSTMLVAQSESRETRNTLSMLEAAMNEWELSAARSLTYGVDGTPVGAQYDFQETQADDTLIVDVLARLQGHETSRTILARINPQFMRLAPTPQFDVGSQQVVDAWDTRIRVVFPGRTWRTADGDALRDADGSYRTPQERRLGVTRNRQILFVSAGPDGQFGDLSGDDAQRAFAADNIHSYEPILP